MMWCGVERCRSCSAAKTRGRVVAQWVKRTRKKKRKKERKKKLTENSKMRTRTPSLAQSLHGISMSSPPSLAHYLGRRRWPALLLDIHKEIREFSHMVMGSLRQTFLVTKSQSSESCQGVTFSPDCAKKERE